MNCIVFDKTGTLTVGKPVVVSTTILNKMLPLEFYELVAATEVGKTCCTFEIKLKYDETYS